jgi:hypothetical protein
LQQQLLTKTSRTLSAPVPAERVQLPNAYESCPTCARQRSVLVESPNDHGDGNATIAGARLSAHVLEHHAAKRSHAARVPLLSGFLSVNASSLPHGTRNDSF